jgi:HOOK domain
VSGLELFYQDRQDAIINNQTVLYDLEGLVRDKDFATLIGIVELIMGVVVNSEDKHQYIEKILQLEEKTQEDLKKLIERSLTRLQMEFAEAS